jgi:hypothetical protein
MLSPVLTTLALVAVWFAIFVAIHVLALRSGRDNAQWLVRGYAACSGAMLASVVALSMWGGFGQALLLSVVLAALTSACLFVLYVPAVYTILTSLSVAAAAYRRRASMASLRAATSCSSGFASCSAPAISSAMVAVSASHRAGAPWRAPSPSSNDYGAWELADRKRSVSAAPIRALLRRRFTRL